MIFSDRQYYELNKWNQGIERNKMAWKELIDELEEQLRGLQSYIKRIDDKQVMEEAIRPALSAYLKSFIPS
jgi:hypothetical protein